MPTATSRPTISNEPRKSFRGLLERCDLPCKKASNRDPLRLVTSVNNFLRAEFQSNSAHCIGCTGGLPNNLHRVNLVKRNLCKRFVCVLNFRKIETREVMERVRKVFGYFEFLCDCFNGDFNQRTYGTDTVLALQIGLIAQEQRAGKDCPDRSNRLHPRGGSIGINRRMQPAQRCRPTDDATGTEQASAGEVSHA